MEKEKQKHEEAEEEEIVYQPDFEDSDEDETETAQIVLQQQQQQQSALKKPQISKEEEIRARVKDLFFRNEFALEISQVTVTFPFQRGSDEYTILFKIIKEVADVVERKLYLKSQYRR